MKTPNFTKPRLPQSIIFAGLILMFSLISACDDSCDCDLNDPCLEEKIGTVVSGASDFPSWPSIDEKNGKWYYFDAFHKTLERFDEKTSQREIIITDDQFSSFFIHGFADSLLLASVQIEGSPDEAFYKFNTITKKGTIIIEDPGYLIWDESGTIFYRDSNNEIYISDFNGNKSKLNVQGQPVSYSKTNNKLLIREELPTRISIYNLDSKLTEPLISERSGSDYNYQWNNNEIIQISRLIDNSNSGQEKLITITDLSKNEVIKKYDDYWSYQLLSDNKIALLTAVKNEKCTSQQLMLYIDDFSSNVRYDSIAVTGNGGYFMNFHLYKNGDKIVYYVFPYYAYFSTTIK